MSSPLKQKKQKLTKTNENIYWFHTLLFSLLILILVYVYQLFRGVKMNVYEISTLFSVTGVIVIGFSLGMSGFSYFIKYFKKFLPYRKYLGLVGFFYVFSHVLFSLISYFIILDSPKPAYDIAHNWNVGSIAVSNLYAFLFGVTAISLFIFMASISNKYAMLKLGKSWRLILRIVGYFAFFIIIFHFGIKNFSIWMLWINTPIGLPPITLVLLIFILFTLFLRIILEVILQFSRRRKT